MSGGRPTKYKKKYCDDVITILSAGKSVTQFARDIKVNKDTIYEWAKKHEDFSDALRVGQEWSQAHWEDKLEEMMWSREVNAPLVKLYFANRFRWHDRPEDKASEDESKPMSFTFNVNPPKSDIKVTRGISSK